MRAKQARHRRLKVGELPTIYVSMRVYNPTKSPTGKKGKMVHCTGLNVTVRNYSPEQARKIIREAFDADYKRQLAEMRAQIGHLVEDPDDRSAVRQ